MVCFWQTKKFIPATSKVIRSHSLQLCTRWKHLIAGRTLPRIQGVGGEPERVNKLKQGNLNKDNYFSIPN